MPVFEMNFDFVPVRSDFVEKYMIKANGSYVKVYLYALLLGMRNETMEQSAIAEDLNLLESDVKNAFDYWSEEGLIEYNDSKIILNNSSAGAENKKTGKTTAQIAKLMSENEQLSALCTMSQEILGKTITTKDMETLFWMYDELGLTVEVILMILEYCTTKDKRSVQYAEKVAITWNEKGINTIEAIENFKKSENERNSYFYALRRLFGISDRALSKKEEEYLLKWQERLKMSEDMVALAYEYCIMQTGKLTFPYMDTILENWNRKGIRTVDAAEKEHSAYKTSTKDKNFDIFKNDVDHSELEKLMHEKYDN